MASQKEAKRMTAVLKEFSGRMIDPTSMAAPTNNTTGRALICKGRLSTNGYDPEGLTSYLRNKSYASYLQEIKRDD